MIVKVDGPENIVKNWKMAGASLRDIARMGKNVPFWCELPNFFSQFLRNLYFHC